MSVAYIQVHFRLDFIIEANIMTAPKSVHIDKINMMRQWLLISTKGQGLPLTFKRGGS